MSNNSRDGEVAGRRVAKIKIDERAEQEKK